MAAGPHNFPENLETHSPDNMHTRIEYFINDKSINEFSNAF